MFPFSRTEPRHLSRYWAALIAGESPDVLEQLARRLDPDMVETIARVRTSAYMPIPDPDFVVRLEKRLVGQLANGEVSRMSQEMVFPAWLAQPTGGTPRVRRLESLVSACLLILLVSLAIWQYSAHNSDQSPGAIASITSVSTPLATPIPTEETLLNVVIPADRIPSGDGRMAGLSYAYGDPGASGWWTGSCCPGLLIQVIVSGNLTLTSRTPVQVLRSNGQLEEVAADAEFVLGPGDTWITRNMSTFHVENRGDVPVQMIEWVYLDDPNEFFAGHILPGWGGAGGLDVTNVIPEFSGDIELKLRRLNLEPDQGDGPPPPGTFRQLVVPNLETEIVRYFGDDTVVAINSQGQITTVYVLDVTSVESDTDLPKVGPPPE